MRAEERIARLEAENAQLREQISQLLGYVVENAALREQVSQLQKQLAELKGLLAKGSHNSSKPPSSDGPRRKPRSQRSEKSTGGQVGHPGHTLMQAAKPDEVVHHRPMVCNHCQQELWGVAGQVIERAPACMICQRCGWWCASIRWKKSGARCESRASRGSFPTDIEAATQYGSNLRALDVYLQEYQLVPLARVSELLCDLYGCHVSEASILSWVGLTAERLAPTVAQIADWVSVVGSNTPIRPGYASRASRIGSMSIARRC